MKKYKNKIIIKNWIKLILSVYNGEENYKRFMQKQKKKITDNEAKEITLRQVKLLNMRDTFLKNLTFEKLLNFSCLEKILE